MSGMPNLAGYLQKTDTCAVIWTLSSYQHMGSAVCNGLTQNSHNHAPLAMLCLAHL